MTAVLLIDHDQYRTDNLRRILEFMECGPIVSASPTGLEAIDADSLTAFEVALVAPGGRNVSAAICASLRDACPSLEVVQLVNGVGPSQVASNVSSLALPLRMASAQKLFGELRARREQRNANPGRESLTLFRSLVGGSASIAKVRELISLVAPTESNVLIDGESGTGKEIVARNVHYHSSRRKGPFVPVNCGAIPPSLLESELFGHERGAFTGALRARQGRFELARGGTLFLDEIGDMPVEMQVKLLRVIEERTFEPVGSEEVINADVRIVAATNCNLESAIKAGSFREDLYYRLNVFPIQIAPLRERLEDIPLLINELTIRADHQQKGSVRLSREAVFALQCHTWPGNVRELANLFERLVVLYPDSVVNLEDLPEKVLANLGSDVAESIAQKIAAQPKSALDLASCIPATVPSDIDERAFLQRQLSHGKFDMRGFLGNLESQLIQQALEDAQGVVAKAANRLGVHRTTLVEKMRKYNLARQWEAEALA